MGDGEIKDDKGWNRMKLVMSGISNFSSPARSTMTFRAPDTIAGLESKKISLLLRTLIIARRITCQYVNAERKNVLLADKEMGN